MPRKTDPVEPAYDADHDALAVETLQTVLAGSLEALARELPVLRELATATHVRSRGFLTGQARVALDTLIRAERAEDAAVAAANRAQPIPPNPLPKMGASPAPVNVSSLELLAQIRSALVDVDVSANKHLDLTDRVLMSTLARRHSTAEPTDSHFVAHLVDIAARVRDLRWLEETVQVLDRLAAAVRKHVHGEATKRLHPRCPWCGERSLMMFRDLGIIVCGRSHDTGTYKPCVCPFESCDCKTRWHRHTWRDEWGFKKLIAQIRDADAQRAREAAELAARQRAAAERLALAIIAGIDPFQED